MRENYKKSIASMKKFPQFTTMNVIDGQAGLIICASLIFYSLTIDNILNIIVLLILAAVSIATLTGENGILTKAQEAKVQNAKSQAEEEVKLAVASLLAEETTKQMTQEEKRQLLEKELKEYDSSLTVEIDGTGFLASHRGYETEIDSKYTVSVKEAFNAGEWDKTATPEDCFLWGSDTEGEAGYNAIVGWTEKIESYSIVRVPSRCQEIVCDGTYDGVTTNEGKGRAFTQNILKVELPETVCNIGNKAFSGHEYPSTTFQKVEEINIPDNVTNIGEYAFYNCKSLTNITIPNSVTSIGNFAFSGCKGVKSLVIQDGVTSIGMGAFQVCTGLMSVTIPSSVEKVSDNMFSGCSGLTSIIIEEGVTSISMEAFSNCTSLTSVIIPNSVTSIGSGAFFDCTSLTSLTIPDSVTTIGSWIFSNCTSLTSVTITDSVTVIGNNAFENIPHIYYNGTATGSPWGALLIN